jgi:hypothetical protein
MKTHDGVETKVNNCIIIMKKNNNEPYMFYQRTNGEILANLDGYAIIPIEEYEKLKQK